MADENTTLSALAHIVAIIVPIAVHDRYGWYNPLRYWSRRKALRHYDILCTAGKPHGMIKIFIFI